jgi:predicted dehydrogenase
MTIAMAIVGGGLIGRQHLARVAAHARCRVTALVDPAPEAAQQARRAGCAHHASLDALLQGPLPDAAIVATPNALHVPQSVALLVRGVPVLVEKPLADSLAAGQQLLRTVRETGVPLLVGHHRRHSAAITAALDCIVSGTLGRIVALNATTLLHKPAAYFETAWRRQPGGGPVLINAVHDIHSLRTLGGDIAAVQARTSSAVRRLDVEDTAAVLLEFASGALGTLIVSDATVAPRSWEHSSGEDKAYPHQPDQDCLFVAGTQGSLAIPTLQLWRQRGPGSWTEPFETARLPQQSVDPLVRQLDHFCDVVERRAAPLVSADHALNTLAATLAVHDAATRGGRVVVPHFE